MHFRVITSRDSSKLLTLVTQRPFVKARNAFFLGYNTLGVWSMRQFHFPPFLSWKINKHILKSVIGSTETFHSIQVLIYLVRRIMLFLRNTVVCNIFFQKKAKVEITEKERFWNLVKILVVIGFNRPKYVRMRYENLQESNGSAIVPVANVLKERQPNQSEAIINSQWQLLFRVLSCGWLKKYFDRETIICCSSSSNIGWIVILALAVGYFLYFSRGIRRSEVQFLMGTQNSFFVPRSWQDEENIPLFFFFLPSSSSLLLYICLF